MIRLFTLIFCLFLSTASFAGTVNINTANAEVLDTLPGIGPVKAAKIIAYRESNGPFKAIVELDNVPGVGPVTLAKLTPLVTIGDTDPNAPVVTQVAQVAQVVPAKTAININTANTGELETLSGIGPSKAKLIVADRQANGPYSNCSDLTRVRGIGAATVNNIGAQCKVN
jgi:competence protein ComEA